MLQRYRLKGGEIDSLDLKTILITRGMTISPEIPKRFGATHRVQDFMDDPTACNCAILPDGVIVHMTNLGPGMPFSMDVDGQGKAYVAHEGEFLTEVTFPPKTQFYEQRTSAGMPFGHLAVLQGLDVLSFPYLWPCEFAQQGMPCQFCFPGGETAKLGRDGRPVLPSATPQDVAEVVDYCVNVDKRVWDVQITGGSRFDARAECSLVAEMVGAVEELTGLENLPGEMYVYTTAPIVPSAIDEVFEAGADRVAYDLNIWDVSLFERICPGHARYTGRERQLAALEYVAKTRGPNKACSAFVVGLEPLESLLAGAERLGSRGIVPLASVWVPHGRPVLGTTEAPGIEYYRRVREAFADIYDRYDLEPPGTAGFNVCMCRDAWNYREEILGRKKQEAAPAGN
jgi:hypothetical protein